MGEQDHLFSIMQPIMWRAFRLLSDLKFHDAPQAVWVSHTRTFASTMTFVWDSKPWVSDRSCEASPATIFQPVLFSQLQIIWKHFLSASCHSASASTNKESSFLNMTVTSGRCGYARWFWCLGHDPVNLFCRMCDGTAGKSQLQTFLETNMWVTESLQHGRGWKVWPFHSPPRIFFFFYTALNTPGSWCQAPANHLPNAPSLAKWLRLKETPEPVLSTTIQGHWVISRSKLWHPPGFSEHIFLPPVSAIGMGWE